MKIIKTIEDIAQENSKKSIANIGCDKCPCCGEKRKFDADRNGCYGILQGWNKTHTKGIFKIKYIKIDCYKCYTCGTEWESEPYEC